MMFPHHSRLQFNCVYKLSAGSVSDKTSRETQQQQQQQQRPGQTQALHALIRPPARRNKLITTKQCVVERRIQLLSLFTGKIS